eukprot:5024589-Prymnesium_polylepis.1
MSLRVFVTPLLLLLLPALASSVAVSASRKLVQVEPLKAMLLMRSWQTRTSDQNAVRTVPDGNKLKAVRTLTGEELTRRGLCKKQFELFVQATSGLASADKSEYPQAKRQLVQGLKIAGAPRGVCSKVFASVGGGATTLSLVETCVLPFEHKLPPNTNCRLAQPNARAWHDDAVCHHHRAQAGRRLVGALALRQPGHARRPYDYRGGGGNAERAAIDVRRSRRLAARALGGGGVARGQPTAIGPGSTGGRRGCLAVAAYRRCQRRACRRDDGGGSAPVRGG